MSTADELRQKAAKIRHAAQHAERLSDARDELALASQLEAEADRLEGKVRPTPPPRPQMSQEDRERARRARINEAFAKLERQLGSKR